MRVYGKTDKNVHYSIVEGLFVTFSNGSSD